jgi:CheY-like chemotaxis protein
MSEPETGRVLIVDDEPAIRDMLARHFRFQGYDVYRAGNGAEALQVLESEPMDVVVTDIMMPVMDGVSLMRELREEHPTVQFIAITGYVELEKLLAAMRLGAIDCLFKPLKDLDELEAVVAQAVARIRRWERKLAELRGIESSSHDASRN